MVPDTVHEVTEDDIFTNASLTGSHAITLGTTVKTGQTVFPEEMPKEIRIILMEAACPTEFSTTCSPEVQAAIEQVTEQMKRDLRWELLLNLSRESLKDSPSLIH